MFLDDEADPAFAKVAKRRLKLQTQERLQAAKSRSTPRKGFHPYSAPAASVASSPMASPSFGSPRPPFDKSKLRCNYCKDFGHFVRECPKTPQAQAAAAAASAPK
jgi:hypothetical protein